MDEKEMADMVKNISNMMNNGNIPDDIKNIINNLKSDNASSTNNSSSSEDTTTSSTNNIDFETILKMKSIFEKMNSNDDPRANLLRSLKPYLKESRKSKVDQYIQLFNMSKVMDIFKTNGGENIK